MKSVLDICMYETGDRTVLYLTENSPIWWKKSTHIINNTSELTPSSLCSFHSTTNPQSSCYLKCYGHFDIYKSYDVKQKLTKDMSQIICLPKL